ncbi:trypsin Inhibitor like cysteine rich domain protein [Oesophagostomum dentatum]|uniref:Trypsin Inhibitor like cysteine rich domain protein n=1 Tax=Oesophagostomum dentatum TaxID=61180 RepID=A0A0B1TIX4_OESDE|nr:trypsin Inhibitor like cysteine rich domain protein [Oesophagostomum dentatum]
MRCSHCAELFANQHAKIPTRFAHSLLGCTKQCFVGCQCKRGFYRNDDKTCVPVSGCIDYEDEEYPQNKTCPPNEEYKTCGTACEPTCRNPYPVDASFRCNAHGLEGNKLTCRKCVPRNVLSDVSANLAFTATMITLVSLSASIMLECTKQCVIGCQCKPGFYRNDNNTCVSVSDCSDYEDEEDPHNKTCPPNEEYQTCGTACEPTCRNPSPVDVSSWYSAHSLERSKLICRKCVPRNVLSDVSVSVVSTGTTTTPVSLSLTAAIMMTATEEESPQETCPPNEVFKECGTACEPTCRNPYPLKCTKQCVVGCQCKPGFYRNEKNVCVSDCGKQFRTLLN